MPVIFHHQPCLEPGALLRECGGKKQPSSWGGLPNGFTCPLGVQSGEGWILLSWKSLREIDSSGNYTGLYDLTFSSDVQQGMGPQTSTVTLRNLVILGASCLTPAARYQEESPYLVRLADRRHLIAWVAIDAGYNCRDLETGELLTDTLSGGSAPWSWSDLVEDLWNQIGTSRLGAFPGLPATPSGTPDQIECWQMSGLEALGKILDRLGFALAYSPLADAFSIVEMGAEDSAFEAALAQWEPYRHWDDYALRSIRGMIPEKVRVSFRRLPHERGATSPYYSVEVADPTAGVAGWEPGTVAILEDDLCALVESGSITNTSELATRAAARAAEFYRRLHSRANRLRLVYPVLLSDPAFLPGKQVQSIRWCDLALDTDPYRGMVTELLRVGPVPRPTFPPVFRPPGGQPSILVQITGKCYRDGSGCEFDEECPDRNILYWWVRVSESEDPCALTYSDTDPPEGGGPGCFPLFHVRDLDLPAFPPGSPRAAYASEVESDGTAGDVPWTQTGSATGAPNDTFSLATLGAGQSTHYLRSSFRCFGIPAPVTITNAKVTIKAKASTSSAIADVEIKLTVDGVVVGTSQHTGTALSTTPAEIEYDHTIGTWGATVTPMSRIGVAARWINSSGAESTVSVDSTRLSLDFDPPGFIGQRKSIFRIWRGAGNYYLFDGIPSVEHIYRTESEDADGVVSYHLDRDQNTQTNKLGREVRLRLPELPV